MAGAQVQRVVKDRRDDEAHASYQHQVASYLADSHVERLVGIEDTADEKAES